MQELTSAGRRIVDDIAARYGLRAESVLQLLNAVRDGGGAMAQFDCPELCGWGQWMQGGMVMIGDPLDHELRATVDGVCSELAIALSTEQIFPAAPRSTSSGGWWPASLGTPSSTGSQGGTRYALFPDKRRLAVAHDRRTVVYDTLDHEINAVSQQQGGPESLTFGGPNGPIDIASLPVLADTAPADAATPAGSGVSPSQPTADVMDSLAALGRLRDEGVLTEDEFNEKKRALLARI